MEQTDIAWLAGLLEGEGSFSCRTSNKVTRPNARILIIQLSMTDEDIVTRAAVLMDALRVRKHHPKPPRKTVYMAAVSGFRAEMVMKLILPYMGNRRRDTIITALQEWTTRASIKLRNRGRMADCHPDRPNKGHGLCDECHRHKKYLEKDLPLRQAMRAAKHRDFIFV